MGNIVNRYLQTRGVGVDSVVTVINKKTKQTNLKRN